MSGSGDVVRPRCLVPPEPSLLTVYGKATLFSTVLVVFSPYLLYTFVRKKDDYMAVWRKSAVPSIKNERTYQDVQLINKMWSTTVGKTYLEAVEYQIREGYCGLATMRCILKSLVLMGKLSPESVPPATSGPMTVKKFAARIDEQSKGATSSRVVLGSEGYEAFLQAIKLSNQPNYRVAINFLRSPLFSAPSPVVFPLNFMKTFFGGHFSVIVGYLESEDVVGVFDVNASYGGLYLVSSRRLFDAVDTLDLQSGEPRGLVVSSIV
jgi:Phytochelatin synthase